MSSKKKYTLFKADANGAPAPCAFFLSAQGCKNGANCKFSHIIDGAEMASALKNASKPKISNKSPVKIESDVSSESDPEESKQSQSLDIFAAPGAKTANQKKKTPNKGVSITPTPTQTSKSNDKKSKEKAKRKQPIDSTSLFCQPADLNQSLKSSKLDIQPPEAKSQIDTKTPPAKKNRVDKTLEKPPSFRDLKLPIAEFSCLKKEENTEGNNNNDDDASPKEISKLPQTESKHPIPKSTPEGRKWQKAVFATRSHAKYQSNYDFDRHKVYDEQNGRGDLWVKARKFGKWCEGNPHAIAIDCEMCETKDPVTGARDPKALCRLSIVNAVDPDEVLIDTLVKPNWPVVNHRSWVNGINQEHLETVQFTLRHAQAFMMALCSEETVIIGHAVHNDLVALKMEHHCIVDSAMLFSVKDEPEATCSLKDLAMAVLKQEMPDVHDSVNDARVAYKCLEEGYIQKNGEVSPIERTYPPRRRFGGKDELFIHRIPKICKPEHLIQMFIAHTCIQPKEVKDIEFAGGVDTGKTTITFSSPDHAMIAFKTLSGEAKPDLSGRLQKRVYLNGGGYIQVRQMHKPRETKSSSDDDKNDD